MAAASAEQKITVLTNDDVTIEMGTAPSVIDHAATPSAKVSATTVTTVAETVARTDTPPEGVRSRSVPDGSARDVLTRPPPCGSG